MVWGPEVTTHRGQNGERPFTGTIGASQVQWSSTVQAWIGLVARLPWYSSVRENGG
jgi:hypothetical protein